MADNKRPFLGLVIIAIFVLIVIYVPHFFEAGVPLMCIEDGNCQHEAYLESIISYIPGIIVFGFLLGVVVSYLYFERKIDVPQTDKTRVILSLLPPTERKILTKIIENGGKALQSEVSRIEGVGKVKAHRAVEKLVKRGVLEKEQLGKTNVLHLRKDLKEVV
ncbi:hypothetical protein JXA56_03715 [Candidatus Micrarchaeota archaeon]|nr:hypothetical protein [Candidatus Micrarchaeota archaeon]